MTEEARERFTVDAPKDVTYERTDEGILIHGDDLGTPYEGEAGGVAPGFGKFATMQEIFGHIDLPDGAIWTPEGYLEFDTSVLASTGIFTGEGLLGDWQLDAIDFVASLGPRIRTVYKFDSLTHGPGTGSPGFALGLVSSSNPARQITLQHQIQNDGISNLRAAWSGSALHVTPEGTPDDSWSGRWIHAVQEVRVGNLSGPAPQESAVWAPVEIGPQRINLYPDPSQPQDVVLLEPISGELWADYRTLWDELADARPTLYAIPGDGRAMTITIAGLQIG